MKARVIARALRLRQDDPELFQAGGYEPLEVMGERRPHVLAFARHLGDRAVIVAVALHCADQVAGGGRLSPPTSWWGRDGHQRSRPISGSFGP